MGTGIEVIQSMVWQDIVVCITFHVILYSTYPMQWQYKDSARGDQRRFKLGETFVLVQCRLGTGIFVEDEDYGDEDYGDDDYDYEDEDYEDEDKGSLPPRKVQFF